MKLTIRHTAKVRDAWIFLLSFLLIFPIGCGFISINFNTKSISTNKILKNNFSSEQFQEVNPPDIIQELKNKFIEIPSTIEIAQPVNDSIRGKGYWNLCIKIKDWLSLERKFSNFSNHLVVQIDDGQPLRINTNRKENGYLQIEFPELLLQNHSITVFTALPWGEAIKSLGSYETISLSQAKEVQKIQSTANPLLILVSPSSVSNTQPILIDWLLFNAPLKNLLKDDAQWHLRISINNTSFLIDRSIPIWIEGLPEGINTLSMDLVDNTGEPITKNRVARKIFINSSPQTLKDTIHFDEQDGRLERKRIIELSLLKPNQSIHIDTSNSTMSNKIKVFQEDESEKILFSKYNLGNSLNGNMKTMIQGPEIVQNNLIQITPLRLAE